MIRKLNKKDIDEVMNIWLETNINTHIFIKRKYWEDNFEYVKKEISNSEVYVYEKEKQIVGFVGIRDGFIEGIFVKENMRHIGIGKDLINKCKKKYSKLELQVYEKNNNAIKFYQKEGFKIIDRQLDKDNNEIELIMKWTDI